MANPTYKYSNGIDVNVVLPALKQRIKWSSDNTPGTSGRALDDGSFHSIVTEENLRAAQKNAGISDIDFATVKAKTAEAAIMRVLNAVFTNSVTLGSGIVFSTLSKKESTEPLSNFIGYAISLPQDDDVTAFIGKAILHFTHTATFKLYCYEEGSDSPFWEQEVTSEAGKLKAISITDLFLVPSSRNTERFYFGYLGTELGGSVKPYEYETYNQRPFLCADFSPCVSPLPVNDDNVVLKSGPIGLNFDLSVFSDMTGAILGNPGMLDEAIGLANAIIVMEQILFSKRINSDQSINLNSIQHAGIQLDLNGSIPASDSPRVFGLKQRFDAEVKRIIKSFDTGTKGMVISI